MTMPEPVSDCDWVPPKTDPTWPVTSTVTTLGAIVAAAASGVPFTAAPRERVSSAVVPVTTVFVPSSSRCATPPPTPPPTTSASASRPAVPGLRDRAGAVDGGVGGGGAGGSTAVVPGCDHQGASGISWVDVSLMPSSLAADL